MMPPSHTTERTQIRKLFRSYAYPAMINMIVLALYNIVDRIFIGQGAGPLAICGLALTLPCVSLLGTMGTLTGVGGAARISAAISASNYKLATRVLGNAVFLNVAMNLILIVYSLFNLDKILLAFGGSEQTIPYAHSYLSILIPGSLLTNLNFTFCHAIRASGFPRKSMMIILTGVIANLILDPVFIFGFNMGIRGAAIATVISMCISSVLIFLHFTGKQNTLRLVRLSFRPDLMILLTIIGVGMAAFIMNITTGMVNIIMNRYLVNYGGDYAIGAYGIISSYSILVSMLLMGICQGMQPIISYHYATGHREVLHDTLKYAIGIGSLIASAGFIIGETGATWLVKAFTWDPQLRDISAEGLRYTFLAMPLVGFQIIVTSYFQSIRQAPKAITMNISRQFVFLIPALSLFSIWWGLTGIWLAIPFADLMATLIALFFILRQARTSTLN
ncbi:MAG: MATE family efflux transporter [Odoribacter sp.]|nr:MATE family efflux transporter [Odoribacter sp.]